MCAPGRIASVFERARAEERAALIVYFTAGDPDLATSRELLAAIARGGADLIELGVPFSDPAADGPVLEAAAARALAAGTRLEDVIALCRELRAGELEGLPEGAAETLAVILFGYANPFLRRGEALAPALAGAGVDGLLSVDLPPDSGLPLYDQLRAAGLDPILLATPTTRDERLEAIFSEARGFLYYVSLVGVTGAAQGSAADLQQRLAELRSRSPLPVAVGFGVDGPEAVARLAPVADGVVVGTALVRLIEAGGPELPARVEAFVRSLREACARG
ncbi:MAG: tryptophan synthase subunit alpha [Deltaproteobacteria bacterium]|nr:tryptophan synthase subunit alpha [Deltaproteobacteria bacterium]